MTGSIKLSTNITIGYLKGYYEECPAMVKRGEGPKNQRVHGALNQPGTFDQLSTSEQSPILFSARQNTNAWLSNFHPTPFRLEGTFWKSVEHFYQASKFLDPAIRDAIRDAETPMLAMRLGRRDGPSARKDWDEIRCEVMAKAVRAKFAQNHDLRERLLNTGERALIENTGDGFWGRGADGSGANRLGKILMELRAELRAEADTERVHDVKEFAEEVVFSRLRDFSDNSPREYHQIVDQLKSVLTGFLTGNILIAKLERNVDSCIVESIKDVQPHSFWITLGDFESLGDSTPGGMHWMGPATGVQGSQPFISATVDPREGMQLRSLVRLEDDSQYVHLRWRGDGESLVVSADCGTLGGVTKLVTETPSEVYHHFLEMINRIQASISALDKRNPPT